MRDRWWNPPEWVAWLDEPVPGYPKRPVLRDEDAAKALKIRATVVPARTKPTLQRRVREHVAAGSALFSDELSSYQGLDALYAHGVINHAVQYVNGQIHTNGIKNFWSLLKWTLGGTYVSVEPFHLFRYLDEQAYRFNERAGKDFGRFRRALTRMSVAA